jgi:hypothetical protein
MRVASLTFTLAATAFLTVGLAVACSTSNGSGPADAGGDECSPIDSACGQPCEPGNSLGIGRFCNNVSDCQGTKIPTVCATLGVPTEHFCTAICVPPDSGNDAGFPTDCGENASCQCQGGQCGCFPNACFQQSDQ